MPNLVQAPALSKSSYGFPLPSHYIVGPTESQPFLDPSFVRPATVSGLPFPMHEDFGPDAFGGKVFVRLPRKTAEQLHISGRISRLRSEQPAFGSES